MGRAPARHCQGTFFADLELLALDIADVATNYPGFAEAMLRLHAAYAEEQLALAERQGLSPGSGDQASAATDPVGEVRHFLAARRNCFPAIDDHAARSFQLALQLAHLEAGDAVESALAAGR